jgi:hypothetical protein
MVETVGLRLVMWLVMLESAKDQILGVDTPGQHMPPHVSYGTTHLLISNAMVLRTTSAKLVIQHIVNLYNGVQ